MNIANHKENGAGTQVEERARQFPAAVAERAKQAAAYVGDQAERATAAVGAGIESLGSAIREHEPACGTLHNAGEAVADKLEGGGRYLEKNGLKGIGNDVTDIIRRNPIPALLIGVGVGILLARMVRR